MKQKGLVLSMSTVLVLITMLWFAAFYSNVSERDEMNIYKAWAVEKAGFVADDISSDINKLLGTAVTVNKGTKFTSLAFYDKLPADTNKLQLIDLNRFVDGNYASEQSADIGLSLGRLLDNKTEMVFSNGLQYDYAYAADQNFVQFRKGDGTNTGVLTYDINIYVKAGRLDTATPWPCDAAGDVNVNLRYDDSYGESTETLNCKQASGGSYTYRFTLQEQTGSITVSFGSVDGNINSVRIKNGIENPLITVMPSIGAVIPSPQNELVWYYDADLNYVQQNTSINRKIELGRA